MTVADEYTPTTEDILRHFDPPFVVEPPGAAGAARRWLAAHDREVAAKVLRDAADKFMPHPEFGLARLADGAADLLRAEADRIESQANEKGAGDGEH